MLDAIVITSYYKTTPQRVSWIVVKRNAVLGSGFLMAQPGTDISVIQSNALQAAEACARTHHPNDSFKVEYWEGVSP
jgi:hypothetical protein